jgi:poly(3-hydroxybutyrate) depolymerase
MDFFSTHSGGSSPQSLQEDEQFGGNPGNLRMFSFVPKRPGKLPLVVVLHGGLQTAEEYASGSGWLSLAEELGFAVLCPEQRRFNHPLAASTGIAYVTRSAGRERGDRSLA